jgi:hypothetical protein
MIMVRKNQKQDRVFGLILFYLFYSSRCLSSDPFSLTYRLLPLYWCHAGAYCSTAPAEILFLSVTACPAAGEGLPWSLVHGIQIPVHPVCAA